MRAPSLGGNKCRESKPLPISPITWTGSPAGTVPRGGVERDLASAKANAYADAARLVRAFALEGEVEVVEDELPERAENQVKRSREYWMAGWKVRVNYMETDPEDQAQRRATVLDVLAKSMMRPK